MPSEITVVEENSLTPQEQLIANTCAKGAAQEELALFLFQCRRTGLDALSRQIYLVKRYDRRLGRDVATIQIGIDGARLIAERTKKYLGQIGPQWCGADAVWRDVWIGATPPDAARVGVIKKGFREPTWGVARFQSFNQDTPLWVRMPERMLEKCAEFAALRKAFPMELSGLYGAEEMGAETIEVPKLPPPPAFDGTVEAHRAMVPIAIVAGVVPKEVLTDKVALTLYLEETAHATQESVNNCLKTYWSEKCQSM